jgi:uncharacterized membrane protein YcgQ (UPF0703/DUF1980 family)
MKKIFLFLVIISMVLACKGKTNNNAEDQKVVELSDKLFILQYNDIMLNGSKDYMDKIISLEGIYREYETAEGEIKHVIYRKAPGCCGDDGEVGFHFEYYDEASYPQPNDWIKVAGRLKEVPTPWGFKTYYLVLNSLEIKQERGKELVTL